MGQELAWCDGIIRTGGTDSAEEDRVGRVSREGTGKDRSITIVCIYNGRPHNYRQAVTELPCQGKDAVSGQGRAAVGCQKRSDCRGSEWGGTGSEGKEKAEEEGLMGKIFRGNWVIGGIDNGWGVKVTKSDRPQLNSLILAINYLLLLPL